MVFNNEYVEWVKQFTFATEEEKEDQGEPVIQIFLDGSENERQNQADTICKLYKITSAPATGCSAWRRFLIIYSNDTITLFNHNVGLTYKNLKTIKASDFIKELEPQKPKPLAKLSSLFLAIAPYELGSYLYVQDEPNEIIPEKCNSMFNEVYLKEAIEKRKRKAEKRQKQGVSLC